MRVRALARAAQPRRQEGDGLRTGLAGVADLWDAAGVGPEDVDLAWVYDDYPVMVLVQLADLGLSGDERFRVERLDAGTGR